MGPTLELQQVALELNGVALLPEITATFAPGQLHVITGPNGAGKSSLLKVMLGLLPHRGRVLRNWAGKPTSIAYVPQQTAFEPSLPVTVAEFLQLGWTRWPFFLGRKNHLGPDMDAVLEEVGLAGKRHLRLGQLSGGERQRLLFARALQQNSNCWFLDEPMTGLDQPGQKLMTRKLQQLKAAGVTLLVVQHDPGWILENADQTWRVEEGLHLEELA
ncbi:metal ABC transporter ATP-binding protein [Marinospirillum sp.]|uniref:metal ABC transporter ATP-binding protein n=1 Tax=Marinospirillum sp. TaxID=2183934 RepID=UPI00286FE159|nr:metal ABC transporter ATP-binding protein [Marinospirillum sp.]MDR9466874.1 metal ABC transporter ATP-binding protein [Marinospirillum sp.]